MKYFSLPLILVIIAENKTINNIMQTEIVLMKRTLFSPANFLYLFKTKTIKNIHGRQKGNY
jgi:hypothetical protein